MSIDETSSMHLWDLAHEDEQIQNNRQKSATPLRRRPRIASKNLSHSFSMFAENNLMDENEEQVVFEPVEMKSVSFYRTDSGFTEASSNFTTHDEDSRYFEIKGPHLGLMRYNDENTMDISMKSDLQL